MTERYSTELFVLISIYQSTKKKNKKKERNKKMATKKTTAKSAIEIQTIDIEERYITIEGDSDLVLNKMDRPTERSLIDQRKDKAKSER